MHVIGAKAQCFYEDLQPEFKEYIKNVCENAKVMCKTFMDNGVRVVSNGTDNHLMLVDVKNSFGITGKEAETVLDKIHITVNKNTIPNETEKVSVTSGIRVGTPAMTTRGFGSEEFEEVANIIIKALRNTQDEEILEECNDRVLSLTKRFPTI